MPRFSALLSWAFGFSLIGAVSEVRVQRLQPGAVQPQIVTDAEGVQHLVYLEGTSGKADVGYQSRSPGSRTFSPPVRVNQSAGSAIAVGTIRGAQLAVGRKDRLHLLWNGSGTIKSGSNSVTPLWYSRLRPDRRSFEPERNLLEDCRYLDGGASVAADSSGHVLIVWHAAPLDDPANESRRRIYVRWSNDDGETFSRPETLAASESGVCACCALKAATPATGGWWIAYRAIHESNHRDMTLLKAAGPHLPFGRLDGEGWETGQCPMSSASLSFVSGSVWVAWESEGKAHFSTMEADRSNLRPAFSPQARGAKHPVTATNRRGETLLAWTEGTGWQRGGKVGWQIVNSSGAVVAGEEHRDGLPVWGTVAVAADPDNGFTVVY
jgi:hypothetical protein